MMFKKNNKVSNYLLRTITLIFKISPLLFLLNIIMYILLALIPLLNLMIMKEIVDLIVDIVQNRASFEKGIILLILQAIISICTWTIESLHKLIILKMTLKIEYSLQNTIFKKTSKLSLVFFDNHESYNIIERASAMQQHSIQTITSILDIMKNSITITTYLIMIYKLHWTLPIIIILLMTIPLFVNIKLGKNKYNQAYEQTSSQRKIHYISCLLTGKEAAKELRLSNNKEYLIKIWEKLFWKTTDQQFSLEKKSVKLNIGTYSINDFVNILFLTTLLYITTKGRLTVGDYFIFSQGITFSLSMISSIALEISNLYEHSVFTKNYFEFLNLEEEKKPKYFNSDFLFKKGIYVKNLSFKYANSDRNVLNNVSFKIKKGEKVAIVGRNGSGKSTLVNCLIGLYESTSGEILYDDRDINEIDPITLRNKISATFQNFVRYQLSFKENVCMSNIAEINNKDKLNQVIKEIDLNDLVSNFKNGYDTELGTAFSGGQELSGGQWQKIALARSLFKESEIVILDEPTAALDPISESYILDKFIKSTKDKTAIFITHRLGICKNMDKIIVLEDGEIVEQGDHQTLLNIHGKYEKMFCSQSSWYMEVK